MKPWWERFPGRLESELAWLAYYDIDAKVDETQKAKGKIVINLEHEVGGKRHRLVAFFPDTYPYTRFEVIAPELTLSRHQNPFGKHLCLIGRSTLLWSTEDTVAKFLVEQFPKVLEIAASDDPSKIKHLEEPQGEPFSDYYNYEIHSVYLIDGAWKIDPACDQGSLGIAIDPGWGGMRGVIATISSGAKTLATADAALVGRFASTGLIHGRWVRWHEPVVEADPIKFLRVLAAKFPKVMNAHQQTGKITHPDVVGVLFPEETIQGVPGDGWVFIVRPPGRPAAFVRAARAGRSDLAGRAPELRPLPSKEISVVGLGSLGAPAAIEFAKTGVGKMHLVDFDFVEAGTVSRWALGLQAAGRQKTDALYEYLKVNYPYTEVSKHWGAVGGALPPFIDLEKIFESELIFDASAELGIQNLLADLAAEKKKTFICISITPGAWGGMLARIRPGKTAGCYWCLQKAIEDKTIEVPVANPAAPIQFAGCASPTFSGAGFDCASVALAGVRFAIGTLCAGNEDGYPDVEWDVGVVNFRDAEGRVVAPTWKTYELRRDAHCPNCNK